MTKQAKYYATKLNELTPKLTPENRDYFTRLSGYMTFSGLLVDEDALTEQLYQMAADLYAAQADQMTAEAFFGKEPQEMADELLGALPRAGWKPVLTIVGAVTGVLWFFDILSDFSTGATWQLSPLSYLVSPVLGVVCITGIIQLIRGSYYPKTASGKLGKGESVALFAIIALYIGGSIVASRLLKGVWQMTIPFPFDVMFIGLLAVALTIWLVWDREKMFYPMALMAYLFMILGIANRILHHFHITEPLWTVWFPAGVLILGMILTVLWNRKLAKELEDVS